MNGCRRFGSRCQAAEGGHDHEQRARDQDETGRAQHAIGEQRFAAAPVHAALDEGEGGETDCRTDQRDPGPHRPVLLVAEDEWQHQQQDGRGERGQSGQIQLALDTDGGGKNPRRDRQQGQADRHVHQKYAAPTASGDIGADEQTAHDLPDHHRAGNHRRIGRQRPRPRATAERLLDQRHHLRHHGRRTHALDESEHDERQRIPRQAAGERGHREQCQPGQEHRPLADLVPGPSAGHQQHGVGDHVTGHDQLQRRSAGIERGANGGNRDIDDRGIENRHELPEQNHGENGQRPAGRQRRYAVRRWSFRQRSSCRRACAASDPGNRSLRILVVRAPGCGLWRPSR